MTAHARIVDEDWDWVEFTLDPDAEESECFSLSFGHGTSLYSGTLCSFSKLGLDDFEALWVEYAKTHSIESVGDSTGRGPWMCNAAVKWLRGPSWVGLWPNNDSAAHVNMPTSKVHAALSSLLSQLQESA